MARCWGAPGRATSGRRAEKEGRDMGGASGIRTRDLLVANGTRSPTPLNAADASRASAASDDGAQQAGGARGVRASEELLAESRRLDELATGLESLGVSLPCQRPVRMMRSGVDSITGEVGEAQEVLIRCGTRLASRCPSCAALYRGDVQAIMREGLRSAGADDAIVFLTLTAPSFGRTHHVPPAPPPRLGRRRRAVWERRHRRRCECGTVHSPGDSALRGVPVRPGSYRYAQQVRWNWGAGCLWSRTADELSRVIGVRDDDGRLVRVPYIAVAEWQARGAVHLHVILRVPRDRAAALGAERDGARGTVRLRALESEVRAVSATVRGERVRWGSQVVAELVASERQRYRVAGYLAKLVQYSVKDLTTESAAPAGAAMRDHHSRLSAAARAMRCGADDVAAGLCAHRDSSESASWSRRCRSVAHRCWGFRGHVVRKSR